MTRSDIIELANEFTERKGEKILDMNLLFASTCMGICKKGRHWWRKWDVQFNTVQGQTTYDLTNPATFTPALTDIAVEEIISISLIIATGFGQGGFVGGQFGGSATVPFFDLTPIFDH